MSARAAGSLDPRDRLGIDELLSAEELAIRDTALFVSDRISPHVADWYEVRYGIVWGSMGAARAAFQTALDYSKTRTQFERPLAAFHLTQQKLANMSLALSKGLLLALHLTLRLGRRKDVGTLLSQQVSYGKLNNTREAIEICRTARTILGANGISYEYPIMRHMNNLGLRL